MTNPEFREIKPGLPARKAADHRQYGMTLIELMIVVAIIGILSAFAYSSYQNQMVKTRRSDATSAILEIANGLEKFYATCASFTINVDKPMPGNCASAADIGVNHSSTSANGYYTLSIVDGTPGDGDPDNTISANYIVIATPVAGRAQANDGMFRLTSEGRRQHDTDHDGTIESNENRWP